MASKRLDALLKAAKAAPKRTANVWKPSPGDSIAGTIRRMRWIRGKGKDEETGQRTKYLSLSLMPDAEKPGDLVVVNCGMLLSEELEEQGAGLGDDVAIVYHGKEGTASGNSVGTYSCAVEKASK